MVLPILFETHRYAGLLFITPFLWSRVEALRLYMGIHLTNLAQCRLQEMMFYVWAGLKRRIDKMKFTIARKLDHRLNRPVSRALPKGEDN